MRPLTNGVKTMRGILFSALIALLIIARPASATVPGGGGTPIPCDFVTGGGFIVGSGTSSLAADAKGNFGVGGGVRNHAFWGHLEYNDHSSSPPRQVHGTGVTGYSGSGNTRIITGNAQVNGMDGFTYIVTVTDNDEPGKGTDEFSIVVDDGYAAGAPLDGPIAGGNIRLHPHNPSNTPPQGFSCTPP